MPAPIRSAWYNRPGWSEYGAPRAGGKHWGYDSYCLPRTTIYAIGDGEVVAKGYAAGGFGHYIDVFYPGLGIRQREAHMAEESGLRVGAEVTASSALGRVGRTGNAKNIYWIRNGVLLEHDHSQAWRGNTTNGDLNVDPRNYWGGTASGDITPITLEEPENEMIKLYCKTPDSQGRNHYLVGEFSFQPLSLSAAQEEWKRDGEVIGVDPATRDRFEARANARRAEFLALVGGNSSGGTGSFTPSDRERLNAIPTEFSLVAK